MKIHSSLLVLPLALIFGMAQPGMVHAQRPDVEPVPVCIYASQSFSEGAQVCMQRNAMLTCTASGDKAVWKAETDRQVNARCLASFQSNRVVTPGPGARPVLAWRARPRTAAAPAPQAAPAAASSGSNCFTFNNRRFCE